LPLGWSVEQWEALQRSDPKRVAAEAAQGIEFHRPLTSSRPLESALRTLRRAVPPYDRDRFFAPDIEAAAALVSSGTLSGLAQGL